MYSRVYVSSRVLFNLAHGDGERLGQVERSNGAGVGSVLMGSLAGS